jgi:alcohol dehydrogenase class IV
MAITGVGIGLWPKKVVVGAGAVKTIGDEVKGLGAKGRIMVLTDQTLKDLPLVTGTVDILKNDGFTVTVFGGISPNPTEAQVENAVEQMRTDKPEAIVVIGGGSPIDVAKAANVVYTHGGKVGEYSIEIGGIERISPKVLPLIAVPTTAGTGSEATMVSVITDTERKVKYGVLSPFIVPDVAILDPELTVSLPPSTTAFTGMDALTHAIESYVSKADFQLANGVSIQAMKMISEHLRTAVNDGKNLEAREAMIDASMMAGFAFNINGLGLCHQIAHTMSAHCDVPHGMANAIILPHVMGFNIPAALKKYADVAEAMGADIRGLSLEAAAEKSVELVEKLSADLNIPKYFDDVLEDVKAVKDKIPVMAEQAIGDNAGMNNPIKTTREECIQVFLKAFK